MFKTTPDLLEKQKAFWDEDLSLPGDSFKDLQEIEISLLNFDPALLDLYSSEEKDLQRIKEMADLMASGTPFPPILIDEKYNLIDGYHRIMALKSLQKTTVPAIMVIQVPR